MKDVENQVGFSIFGIESQKYQITSQGIGVYETAKTLLIYLNGLSTKNGAKIQIRNGLEWFSVYKNEIPEYLSQEYSVADIHKIGSPLIKMGFKAWCNSNARATGKHFKKFRPFLAMYKQIPSGWLCHSIGDQSAYASFFGEDWAINAVGRLSEEDDVGDEFNAFVHRAYQRVFQSGGLRYDHLFAMLPEEKSGNIIPITFQRLLAGVTFPDGEIGISVLVDITKSVNIDDLDYRQLLG